MIASLAVSSVDLKLSKRTSILTGNYEYYYACGLLEKRSSPGLNGDLSPSELYKRVQDFLSDSEVDPDGDYLIYLLKRYEPDERYDSQMKDLFISGTKS
ncbi:DUF3837 family protein [Candidatus Weimeria sp. HCP3S3_B5]|uniref:DUF3837 family protein n=1 Tax=Candidatus Weimeria sp. HCP3S3_B5 TaxID=3438871 RepID=UPI003F89B4A2